MGSNQEGKWPSKLVIVRHAESEGNLRREYLKSKQSKDLHLGLKKRDADYVLSDLGREQARATGQGLRELGPFDHVYVSPYQRTRETAEIILREMGSAIPMVFEERIREKEYGILEGLTHHGIDVKHPEEVERKKRVGKYYYRPPGGESYPDVNLRVHSLLGTFIREHAGDSILVVAHSVVVLSFRRMLERLEEAEILHVDEHEEIPNAGVLAYDLAGRGDEDEGIQPRIWNRIYWDITAAPAAG